MNYALIGCGRIAKNHLQAALDNNLKITAVCDILPDKTESLLAGLNLATRSDIARYTDYRQMLKEQPELELISIATESGNHAGIALDCIAAEKHVIIEKPMAMSIADADAIIKAERIHGVKVAVCHQNRFNLAVQKMRLALENGRFGKISHGSVHVRWNRDKAYYEQAPWRGTWQHDGGALMNQCIHGIDLLVWMLGDNITTVYGQTRQQCHDYLETEDVGLAVLTCANGTIATIEGTTNVYPRNLEETLYLFGEHGTVKLGGKSLNKIDVWDFAATATDDVACRTVAENPPNVYGHGHGRLFADMIDAMRDNRAPYVDAYAGKRAVEIVLAIYRSSMTGEPVHLPLVDASTLDFAGTFNKAVS